MPVFIIMGVCGSGKSTIGTNLAKNLSCSFLDADDFHPQSNLNKMVKGVPLNDDDRKPWLITLNEVLISHTQSSNTNVVLGCSALKISYRASLSKNLSSMVFIHLQGTFDTIISRLNARVGHYMKPSMLQSQFAALELPPAPEVQLMTKNKTWLTLNIDEMSVEECTLQIERWWSK